jgi:hypothetical protein
VRCERGDDLAISQIQDPPRQCTLPAPLQWERNHVRSFAAAHNMPLQCALWKFGQQLVDKVQPVYRQNGDIVQVLRQIHSTAPAYCAPHVHACRYELMLKPGWAEMTGASPPLKF